MSSTHYLVRNRHSNVWYARVVIPKAIRAPFHGRRELRRSLNTCDKKQAKFLSLSFWVQCQQGFERVERNLAQYSFANAKAFTDWLDQNGQQARDRDMYIEFKALDGTVMKVDLDDPKAEAELALKMQAANYAFYQSALNDPVLMAEMTQGSTFRCPPPTGSNVFFEDAADTYFTRLKEHGRKGKKLSPRTLINYETKVDLWKAHFGGRLVQELVVTELSTVHDWLPNLRANFKQKGLSAYQAISEAQSAKPANNRIALKTMAEYLGQLKAILQFCHTRGYTQHDISWCIEIPNTKQSRTIKRLPFSDDDLKLIFPDEDYGVDFGANTGSLDQHCKHWFPLLALYTGARLEEIAQLTTDDIKTCPDTNIRYLMITNEGLAGDGEKKHTKNLNSVRPVPIHSELVRLGFLDYVDERRKEKQDKRLFKLKRDKQGRLGRSVTTWFSRFENRKDGSRFKGYIERRGVISKGVDETGQRWSKSFHSFRHTFVDNLRGKKMANGEYIREQDIGLVVGHDKTKLETNQYGQDRMQLEFRRDIIESVQTKMFSF